MDNVKRARTAPGDLADEILTDGGRWSLDSVRFRPQLTTSRHSFAVTIDVDGRSVWSGVRLDSRPARDARPAAELLERAGYEILSVRSMPFFARRSLRGFRELDADVRRLDALAHDRSALKDFRARAPRERGHPSTAPPFSIATFERLRDEHGWVVEQANAARRGPVTFAYGPGWLTGARLWAADIDDDRRLGLHVQVYGKRSDAAAEAEREQLSQRVREILEPLGYTLMRFTGRPQQSLIMLEKDVSTLAAARRERKRLDRVLFGDRR